MGDVTAYYAYDVFNYSTPIKPQGLSGLEAVNSFSPVSYTKSALILEAVEEALNAAAPDAMWAMLNAFVSRYRYACYSSAQFEQAVVEAARVAQGEAAAKKMERFLQSWIRQPGLPVVRAVRSRGKLVLVQQPFVLNHAAQHVFAIPLTLHIGVGGDTSNTGSGDTSNTGSGDTSNTGSGDTSNTGSGDTDNVVNDITGTDATNTTTQHIFFAMRTHTVLLPPDASVTITAPPSIPLVLAQPELPLTALATLDAATLERETRSRFLLLRNEQLTVQEFMPFLETVLHQLSAQSSLPQLALTLSVLQDLRTLLRTPEQQALYVRWCVEHLAPLREQALRGELDASVQKTLLFFLLQLHDPEVARFVDTHFHAASIAAVTTFPSEVQELAALRFAQTHVTEDNFETEIDA
ncbi:hypothetical protein BLSTO_05707, partial [Blastocystis sp. subtype 1]